MTPYSVYSSTAEMYCIVGNRLVSAKVLELNLYSHDSKTSCVLLRDISGNHWQRLKYEALSTGATLWTVGVTIQTKIKC